MFFTVCLSDNGENRYVAIVPDLPGCKVVCESKARALTDIHLAIETRIAALLGNGEATPQPRSIEKLRTHTEFAGDEFFSIHINLDHLQAVAIHQAGRWG
jgi:predicted RNase H-like HicB family nuclease